MNGILTCPQPWLSPSPLPPAETCPSCPHTDCRRRTPSYERVGLFLPRLPGRPRTRVFLSLGGHPLARDGGFDEVHTGRGPSRRGGNRARRWRPSHPRPSYPIVRRRLPSPTPLRATSHAMHRLLGAQRRGSLRLAGTASRLSTARVPVRIVPPRHDCLATRGSSIWSPPSSPHRPRHTHLRYAPPKAIGHIRLGDAGEGCLCVRSLGVPERRERARVWAGVAPWWVSLSEEEAVAYCEHWPMWW